MESPTERAASKRTETLAGPCLRPEPSGGELSLQGCRQPVCLLGPRLPAPPWGGPGLCPAVGSRDPSDRQALQAFGD